MISLPQKVATTWPLDSTFKFMDAKSKQRTMQVSFFFLACSRRMKVCFECRAGIEVKDGLREFSLLCCISSMVLICLTKGP